MAQLQATTVNGTLNSLRTENIQVNSYTLALADRDRVVAMNNTGNVTVTIPNDSTVDFPIGSLVYVTKLNTGGVTLAAASGVTATATGNFADSEELLLRKRANNFWMVIDVPRPPGTSGGVVNDASGFRNHTFTVTGSTSFIIG
jgi:hypothetical protein